MKFARKLTLICGQKNEEKLSQISIAAFPGKAN